MTQVENIKHAIEQINQQLATDATFSESALKQRYSQALQTHYRHQDFLVVLTLLPSWLMERFSEGWTYIPDQYSIAALPDGSVRVVLQKPQQQYSEEVLAIQENVKAQYMVDLESNKQRLLKELAEANLRLKEAEAEDKAQEQYEKKLQKELNRLTEELFPTEQEIAA